MRERERESERERERAHEKRSLGGVFLRDDFGSGSLTCREAEELLRQYANIAIVKIFKIRTTI